MFCEVFCHTFTCCHHGFFARLPVGWANLSVLQRVLPCVHDAERVLDVSAEVEEVDVLMPYDPFLVDQECASERDRCAVEDQVAIFVVVPVAAEHAVVGRDGLRGVRYDGVGDSLDTTLVLGCVQPCEVCLFRVG